MVGCSAGCSSGHNAECTGHMKAAAGKYKSRLLDNRSDFDDFPARIGTKKARDTQSRAWWVVEQSISWLAFVSIDDAHVHVRSNSNNQALKLEPQPQVVVALGLLNTNPRPISSSLKSIDVPERYRRLLGSQITRRVKISPASATATLELS